MFFCTNAFYEGGAELLLSVWEEEEDVTNQQLFWFCLYLKMSATVKSSIGRGYSKPEVILSPREVDSLNFNSRHAFDILLEHEAYSSAGQLQKDPCFVGQQ